MSIDNTLLWNFECLNYGANNNLTPCSPHFTFIPLFDFNVNFNFFNFNNQNFFELFQGVNNFATTSFTNFEFQKVNDNVKSDSNINSIISKSPPKLDVKLSTTIQPKSNFTNYTKSTSGSINHSYINLSQKEAFEKAKTDSNLEQLCGGTNWSISEGSFVTDIPFAKKGTAAILDKVTSLIGEKLVITSALGTGEAGNPHVKNGYASHHNAENPKLDIRLNGDGKSLAKKLKATGYFSRVSLERDHLDVQIDPSKYQGLCAIA